MKHNGLMSNIQSVQVHINRPVSESFWQLEINLELGVKVIVTGAHAGFINGPLRGDQVK